MLGYDCPENFDHPYMTASVSEFWRRWHMTLGAWFRDYVYIPMGGSRVTKPRLILNLFAVWLLTGLWHGFNLHFLIWAGGYFLLIVFEKLSGFPKKLKSKAAKLLYRIAVLFFINFQWVWFSAEDSSAALTTLRGMLTLHGSHTAAVHLRYILTHDLLLLAAAVLFCFPVVPRLRALAEGKPKLLTVFRVGGASELRQSALCLLSARNCGLQLPESQLPGREEDPALRRFLFVFVHPVLFAGRFADRRGDPARSRDDTPRICAAGGLRRRCLSLCAVYDRCA